MTRAEARTTFAGRRTIVIVALVLWLCVALAGGRAFAAAGGLDPGFGTQGAALVDSGGSEVATAVAIQPDGKIVVAGYTTNGATGYDAAVYRLKANGSLDKSFGGDGKVTIDSGGNEYANAVVIQPDGKIVVAGSTTNASTQLTWPSTG